MNIMKNKIKFYILIISTLAITSACKKSFLDAKPSTSIVAPKTLAEAESLLEASNIVNRFTPSLSQIASDDYTFIDYSSWQSAQTATERNSYIWAKDIYAGETGIYDWRLGFTAIFYCNNVLEILNKIDVTASNSKQYNDVKARALFLRAYAYYDLARNFCPFFDQTTAASELGLPIRLSAGIDEIVPRSNLKQTYDQIFSDLKSARSLFSLSLSSNSNRPCIAATFALYSRIYLSFSDFVNAEKYADSTLSITNKLIDYNTVSKTASAPFAYNNDETIFTSSTIPNDYLIAVQNSINTQVTINPDLIKLYDPNDLRLPIYFGTNSATGRLYSKRRYAPLNNCFSGLATDEIYLTKSECLARRNQVSSAMSVLNTLLKKRFAAINFKELTALDQFDAINKILLERRKELVWRTLRWTDLKRLNKGGANITLTRLLNGITYTLPPNDPRYVFPIPDEEIALSGIQQNIR
jgi:hypothetical protein